MRQLAKTCDIYKLPVILILIFIFLIAALPECPESHHHRWQQQTDKNHKTYVWEGGDEKDRIPHTFPYSTFSIPSTFSLPSLFSLPPSLPPSFSSLLPSFLSLSSSSPFSSLRGKKGEKKGEKKWCTHFRTPVS